MKVLQIANAKTVKGGITSVVNAIVDGMAEQVQMGRHASYIAHVPAPTKVMYSLGAMMKLCFVLPSYELVHLHSAANGSFYRKAIYTRLCKLFGKKVIFHIHGSSFESFHNRSRFNAWIIARTLNAADAIIVLSNQMKQLTAAYCSNKSIHIVPNPITIPEQSERLRLKQDHERVQLLFMGEIGRRKGIYDLVTALSCLPKEIVDRVALHICGNNELDQLRQCIREHRVEHACVVHGWIDGERKRELLANADIYVLPSYHEGLPVSILEAMAYELPIISTDVGGIPEIVRDYENGLVIKPGSVDQLAASIETLVQDEALRRRFGQRSKQMVMPHDIRDVAEQLKDIYSTTLTT